MKRYPYIVLMIFIVMAQVSCRKTIGTIPAGTWKYRLLVNGADIGRASVSNAIIGGRYVSTMDMEMDAGYVKNTTRQVITETTDFRPVMLEVYNKTVQNGQTSEIKTIAKFSGTKIEVDTGGSKSTIQIDKSFILEGNYFMSELIKGKFKQGMIVKNYIYEPSVDLEEPVLVIVKVIGREDVPVNGKIKKLIHVGFSIENLKNIDSYIDDEGITQKTVITMLNNRLELVLE